jgi:DNA-binding CsgD family transcriptional regulator
VTRLAAPQALLDHLVDADSAVRVLYGICALPTPRSLSAALGSSANTIEQVMRSADIEHAAVEQVSELLAAQLAAQQSMADELHRSAGAVAGSVRRLSGMGIGANLPRQMCVEIVDAAPFEHAVFSTIDEAGWQVHVEYPAGVNRRPMRLTWDRSPAERRSLCAREVLVTGIDCAPTAEVAAHLNTTDYVVAPVVAESKVVGLLHAARALPMKVDNAGAALVSLLVSNFGAAYELQVWSHRVRAHRELVSACAARLVHSSAEGLGSELEIFSAPTELRPHRYAAAARDPISPLDWLLTPRESEVMHLIAGGASNAEIAETLFIATETVKSHVKHILRKLGAVNRSEAISLYLDRG